VVEIEKFSEFCKSNVSRFQSLEGSEHIATFSSQLNLASIIVDAKARNVLDFGTGIGTLVPLILQFSEAKIYAVEKMLGVKASLKRT
jgi:tRNA1(Val) A37 N6-methylase TrmN6